MNHLFLINLYCYFSIYKNTEFDIFRRLNLLMEKSQSEVPYLLPVRHAHFLEGYDAADKCWQQLFLSGIQKIILLLQSQKYQINYFDNFLII